ncbi:hypothetical protein D3C79_927720 [compost metagenome]
MSFGNQVFKPYTMSMHIPKATQTIRVANARASLNKEAMDVPAVLATTSTSYWVPLM